MRDYVLPDYTHIKRGFIRPMEETTGKAKGNEQVRYTHYCNSNLIWHTVFSRVDEVMPSDHPRREALMVI